MNTFKTLGTLFCIAIAAIAMPTPSAVANDHQPQMHVLEHTAIPIGHARFCARLPDECVANDHLVNRVHLTEQNWRELLHVNAKVNAIITPMSDMEFYATSEHWTFPNTYGDCEDYVLLKRAALIERGWPASTLLITVVHELSGSGHAVLTVRTDRGDLILDNQDGLVHLWHQTSYHFIKRQSQHHQGVWVSVHDNRAQHVRMARLNVNTTN